MTSLERISKLESFFRPMFLGLDKKYLVSFYSNQKKKFLKKFAEEYKKFEPKIFDACSVKIWGLEFNVPIYNAAGMFKYGESYYTVAKQGAGSWLFGTTTGKPRLGNFKNGVLNPFIPLPNSKSSLNWMGLPNKGHLQTAKIISNLEKQNKCPIGVSMSYDPGMTDNQALELMIEGIQAYTKAGVDFIEINESCPNLVEGHTISNTKLDSGLINRIEYLNEKHLQNSNLPVIIKLSNDTNPDLIPDLVSLLSQTHFSAINFGNTSTKYDDKLDQISNSEKKIFQNFNLSYGGGISGIPLREDSLNLSTLFSQQIKKNQFKREFHIISTGGIVTKEDIDVSLQSGATLCNWYTGYFANFSKFGHNIYKEMFK